MLNAMRLTRPYVDGASRGGACHKLVSKIFQLKGFY